MANGVLAGSDVCGRERLVSDLAAADKTLVTAAAEVVVDAIAEDAKQVGF